MQSRTPFLHERLVAYHHAIAFYLVAKKLRSRWPRGLGELSDQLVRASSSVVLNIAEGAAAGSPDLKRRFFKTALASAGECAALLDLARIEGAISDSLFDQGREELRMTTVCTLGLAR